MSSVSSFCAAGRPGVLGSWARLCSLCTGATWLLLVMCPPPLGGYSSRWIRGRPHPHPPYPPRPCFQLRPRPEFPALPSPRSRPLPPIEAGVKDSRGCQAGALSRHRAPGPGPAGGGGQGETHRTVFQGGRGRGDANPEAFERPSVSLVHIRGPGAWRGGRHAALGPRRSETGARAAEPPSCLPPWTGAV